VLYMLSFFCQLVLQGKFSQVIQFVQQWKFILHY
jgi:hypothetical protein